MLPPTEIDMSNLNQWNDKFGPCSDENNCIANRFFLLK